MASAHGGPVTHANGCHISVSSDIYFPPPPLQPPPHPPRPSLQGRRKGAEAFHRQSARAKRPSPPARLVPLPPFAFLAGLLNGRLMSRWSADCSGLCLALLALLAALHSRRFLPGNTQHSRSAGLAVDHYRIFAGFKNRGDHRHKNIFSPFLNSVNPLNAHVSMTHPEHQTSHLPFVVAIPQRRFYRISALRRRIKKKQQLWRTIIAVSGLSRLPLWRNRIRVKSGLRRRHRTVKVPTCRRFLVFRFLSATLEAAGHI